MVVVVVAVSIVDWTPLHPILRSRPLVFVGVISYGVYLLHNLCANMARIATREQQGILMFAVTLVAVVAVAYQDSATMPWRIRATDPARCSRSARAQHPVWFEVLGVVVGRVWSALVAALLLAVAITAHATQQITEVTTRPMPCEIAII